MKTTNNEKVMIKVDGWIVTGWENIISTLKRRTWCKSIIAIECGAGLPYEELKKQFTGIDPILFIDTKDLFIAQNEIEELVNKKSDAVLSDYFDFKKIELARKAIDNADDNVVVFGYGAHLVVDNNILIYLDASRTNAELSREERILNKHKRIIAPYVNYWMDVADENKPKMIDQVTFAEIAHHIHADLDAKKSILVQIGKEHFQIPEIDFIYSMKK